ncbi:MAG: hypothetical protein JRC58_08545 [Deltaproteobacteria bacterium]|nr:hypothetical protein [Deltaproteobacteria bacterium]
MMLLVRRFKTNLEADQNRYVRKKIGNRMDGICDEGLTVAENPCHHLQQD